MTTQSYTATASPLRILLALYEKDYNYAKPLVVEGLFETDVRVQIALLQCDTKQHRSDMVRLLDCKTLNDDVAKRLRFKCLLANYFAALLIVDSKQITKWNTSDCIVSIFSFCIENESIFDDKKLKATWSFLQNLKDYFVEFELDGNTLITRYLDERTSLGLSIVKAVSKHFGFMSGKYAHVKKHLVNWWKAMRVRHHREPVQTNVPISADIRVDIIVAPAAVNVNIDAAENERWYWLCDDGDDIRWIPYQQKEQLVIMQAWNEKTETCVIVLNKYRIDFARESGVIPCGQQYNCQLECPTQREVVYGNPNSMGLLNGIFCESMPK